MPRRILQSDLPSKAFAWGDRYQCVSIDLCLPSPQSLWPMQASLRRSDETPVIVIDIRVVNLPWVRMREPIGEQKLLDRDSFNDGRLKLPAPNGEQLAFRKRLCKPNEVQRT